MLPYGDVTVSMGWLSAIHRLVTDWLWVGYWLVIGYVLAGHQLAIYRLVIYTLAMGWLSSIYGLAISSPPFDTMMIVMYIELYFIQYQI